MATIILQTSTRIYKKEIISIAVYSRPSIFYGWAPKNTRPEIPSNEKGRINKLNGMILVDAFTGEEYLKLK